MQKPAAYLVSLALLAGGCAAGFSWLRSAPLDLARVERSVEVVDREGRLLRPFALADGRWRLSADLSGIDRRYIDMLVAYEDQRFFSHSGVDPLAMLRAVGQLVSNGRVVSGGSTITMQVARLLEPRAERTIRAKLSEMRRAISLEAKLSKDEILALYLTLAPYGGSLEGVRAASLAYFGKEPRKFSLGEAALLVALPQSPELRRPDRAMKNAVAARERVLKRMIAAGVVREVELERALAESIPTIRRAMPFFAPHAAEAALAARPGLQVHKLAIDRAAQERVEELLREKSSSMHSGLSAAILVIDNVNGEILARAGSPDFYDTVRAGQVDMTRAMRSPGSALKPFIYGIAFEDGIAHPDTLIEDRPTRFGGYAPANFDLSFQGTVTLRRALQLSLNVPAVALLDAVGPQRFTSRMTGAGARLELPQGEIPGLAIGLGGIGVRLEDLALLYSSLARLGEARPLIARLDETSARASGRLLEPVASWYVGQALAGSLPPDSAAGGRIAFKTGTSYGYRDAWSAGFDGRHTVAVWVGRPDGQPVTGLTGRQAAAPILFDTFARIASKPTPLPSAPDGALIASTSKLPLPLQRFGKNDAAADSLKIVFPPNGAELAVEGEAEPVFVKTSGGAGPLSLFVDGVPAGRLESGKTISWQPRGPGFARLTVMDASGASDSVFVRVQQ
jgi:penicillin-binding protein 1C